jgi:hypothetical protein
MRFKGNRGFLSMWGEDVKRPLKGRAKIKENRLSL